MRALSELLTENPVLHDEASAALRVGVSETLIITLIKLITLITSK